MTIQSVLEELIYASAKEIMDNFRSANFDITKLPELKSIPQATRKILSLIEEEKKKWKKQLLSELPEEKEVGEMRYGGCNPDEDRGWNQALTDIKQKVEGL